MDIDKTTLADLSILGNPDEQSVFQHMNGCITSGGKEKMRDNFMHPLNSIEAIKGVQQTIRLVMEKQDKWPGRISNGSVMVIEKFYQSTIDEIPENPSTLSALSYKLLHGPDHSLVKYSVTHCFDFIKGMQELVKLLDVAATPAPLKILMERARQLLDRNAFGIVAKQNKFSELSNRQFLSLAHFLRYRFREEMHDLLDIYFQLDAWYGMAASVKRFGLSFPSFDDTGKPILTAKGLFHVLLEHPVDYDITLDNACNFLFLTGANMAGKSTFIKAVGTAVYLAHLGMGVPAKEMRLCLFDGMLSNINITDNLFKGESYFYNEVQRIKSTVTKIADGRKWLILIDELFKGTNVEDAMKCSTTVIEGLLKIRHSLFILSTHLYEIGEGLKKYPNIRFSYFETQVKDEQLHFNYHLREGISNDRLGYLILKREGVTELLQKL